MSDSLRIESYETRVSTRWFTARATNMTLGDLRAIVAQSADMSDETSVEASKFTFTPDLKRAEFGTLRLCHERKFEDANG